jgi:hypothetical protein
LKVLLAMAFAGAFAVSCKSTVDVPVPVVDIVITGNQATLVVGQTMQLVATPKSASGNEMGARPVEWSVSNPSATRVSSSGLVAALAPGSSEIIVKSEQVTKLVPVTVLVPPAIALSTDFVAFTAAAGGAPPAARSVSVANTGGSALTGLTATTTYTLGTAGWLTASLESTTATTTTPAPLSLSVSIAGRPAGSYVAVVTIAAPNAQPQSVTVQLTLTP